MDELKPCPFCGNTNESSYIDLLTQLHDAVQSDECMQSCDKISILNKITQLEQALEKYSG